MSLKEALKEEAGRRGLDLVEGRLNGVCVCVCEGPGGGLKTGNMEVYRAKGCLTGGP